MSLVSGTNWKWNIVTIKSRIAMRDLLSWDFQFLSSSWMQLCNPKRAFKLFHQGNVCEIHLRVLCNSSLHPFRSTSRLAAPAAPLAADLWPVPLRQLHHGPHHRLRRQPLLHPVWYGTSSQLFRRQGRWRWKTCPQTDLGTDTGSTFVFSLLVLTIS